MRYVKAFLRQLQRPRVVVVSIALGVLCGLYSPVATHYMSPISTIFFALLKMCALPIVMTAVILSFARLWSSGHVMQYLSRVSVIFVACLIATSLLGSTLSIPVSDYLLGDPHTLETLSKMMRPSGEVAQPSGKAGIVAFVVGVIPKNIFRALSEGEMLGALLFVILLGISIGMNRPASLKVLLLCIDGLNEAFFRMIGWFTYLLPIALCSIVSQMVSNLDGDSAGIFGTLFSFLLGGIAFMVFLQFTIARFLLQMSWKDFYCMIREPALIALSSSSSLASLPSLTLALESKAKAPRWLLDLMLPVGITFCQHATVFFYSFLALFVAKVYGISIGPIEIVLIGVGAYLQSLVSAGLPAAASVGFLAAVFRPVGIPIETMGVILVAVLPLLDPFLTLANITGQLVSVSAMLRLKTVDKTVPATKDGEDVDPVLGIDV